MKKVLCKCPCAHVVPLQMFSLGGWPWIPPLGSPTLTEGLRINPGLNVSYQLVFSSILLLLSMSLPSSDPPVVRVLKASVGLVRSSEWAVSWRPV